MRVLRSAAALAAILASSVVAAQTITFGDATPRQLPKEFEVGLTGGGPPPHWAAPKRRFIRGARDEA